jgi:hypothetical protein
LMIIGRFMCAAGACVGVTVCVYRRPGIVRCSN